MHARLAGHLRRNLVAYLALFVALGGTGYAATQITGTQVKDGSLTGADIRNGSVTGSDIRKGSLRANLFARGQLPSGTVAGGSQGPKGDTGAQGPAGPTFGESIQVPNRKDIECYADNVVGQQAITVTRPSRILAFANGALMDDGASTSTYGLYLRLRDAADTATLGVTTTSWDYDDSASPVDQVMPLSVTSMVAKASNSEVLGPTLVVQPGTYRLQLIALANESPAPVCPTAKPDFGYNGTSGMGYALLGTAP